jgi:hypothetical protein
VEFLASWQEQFVMEGPQEIVVVLVYSSDGNQYFV